MTVKSLVVKDTRNQLVQVELPADVVAWLFPNGVVPLGTVSGPFSAGNGSFLVDALGNVIARTLRTTALNGFHVNPYSGNDSNSGLTPSQALKTAAGLAAAFAGMGTGGWVDLSGASADIATINNGVDGDWWNYQFDLGNRVVTGPKIFLDTTQVNFLLDTSLVLPNGCEFTTAVPGQKAKIRRNRSLVETWTQPNAVTYPYVWGTAGTTYRHSLVWEYITGLRAQLVYIVAPNLATALPLLQAETRGASYCDPVSGKIYIRAIGGGNPNTDGVIREYSQWTNPTNGSMFFCEGCYVHDIDTNGGGTVDPVTGAPDPDYLFGVFHNPGHERITVIKDCVGSLAAKHHIAFTGGDGSDSTPKGLMILKNVELSLAVGGIGPNNQNHVVSYAAYVNATPNRGKLLTIFDNVSTPDAVSAVGVPGADPTQNYTGMFSHAETNGCYKRQTYRNCKLGGNVLLADAYTQEMYCYNSTLAGVTTLTTPFFRVYRTRFDYCLPQLRSANGVLTDCILTGKNTTTLAPFVGAPQGISGDIALTRCTIDADVSRGSNNANAWTRAAPLVLTVDGVILLGAGNVIYGLIYGLLPADTLVILKSLIGAEAGAAISRNYNGDGTVKTIAQAVTAGWIDGASVVTTSPGIDFTQSYGPFFYSPALALAGPDHNAPDFTDVIFGYRDTAGAIQYVGVDPLPRWAPDDPLTLARFEAGINLFQDIAATTPITAAGQNVAAWFDPEETNLAVPTRPYIRQATAGSQDTSNANGGVNVLSAKAYFGPDLTLANTSGGQVTVYLVVDKASGKGIDFISNSAGSLFVRITADNHVRADKPDTGTNSISYDGPDSGLMILRFVRAYAAGIFQWVVSWPGNMGRIVIAEVAGTITFAIDGSMYGADANMAGSVRAKRNYIGNLTGTATELRVLADLNRLHPGATL